MLNTVLGFYAGLCFRFKTVSQCPEEKLLGSDIICGGNKVREDISQALTLALSLVREKDFTGKEELAKQW